MITISTEMDLGNLVCGRCTVATDYSIALADDKVYHFFGDNSIHQINMLVYEDDRKSFEDLFSNTDNNEPVVVRLMRYDGRYRWCLIFVVQKNPMADREQYTQIEIRDIIALNDRFFEADEKANKYRNLMNMINERFFEYDFETRMFKIYSYRGNRCEMLERDLLDEFEKKVIRLEMVDEEAVASFHQLCENIRSGVDNFTVQFETSILKKGERKEALNFRGQTIMRGRQKTMVVGLVGVVNRKSTDKDYYYTPVETNLDSATGLMNKRAITEFIVNRINVYNSGRESKGCYLIILDIDNFKTANDKYGHMFGDDVILSLARTIRDVIGNRGVVGRIGGDEFIILLEDIDDMMEVRAVLTAIRKSMAWEFQNKMPQYSFTCSIGVSQYGTDATDYETLFRIADKSLYIAKNKGGDRFIIYNRELHGDLDDTHSENGVSQMVIPVMKMIDKSKMITEHIRIISDTGNKGIQSVINEISERMNINGISVYAGTSLYCAYSAGFYKKIIQNAEYIYTNDYLKYFDENGINVLNNIEELSYKFESIYNIMQERRVCSTLQILIRDRDGIIGMVSFDVIGLHRRKWSELDISLLYLEAGIIGDAIRKEIS